MFSNNSWFYRVSWKYIATCSSGQFSKKKFPPLGMPYPTVVTVSREKAKALWKDMGSPAGPSMQLISLESFKSTHAVLSKARLGGVRISRCAAGGRRGTSWGQVTYPELSKLG